MKPILVGLLLIIPISGLVEVLDRNVDDFDTSFWMWIPLVLLLGAYALTGALGSRSAKERPLLHGALAALGAFVGWLAVRCIVPLAKGDDLGFGIRNVVVNAMLAVGFGLLGALAAGRNLEDGDEPAGWPRAGAVHSDPSEERPDSTGQGAG